ncbi:hypothetical protein AX17_000303 [Amanita inopinata Kibby_2008]|nr:hypothetical protein AX17_000303 [Amanita inopinata Kibby_2008]
MFKKAKFKLGKKQTPSNVIDTSFKARSIVLPSQSITVQKSIDTPTTKRRLTVDDLLVHLKHYNAATRRDAIFGVRELLESHWDLLELSLVPLLNGLFRLIGDEDASVRKALISLLTWLLPRISVEDLIPHSSLLLLFTTSALTHIFPEIRIDAVHVLNILLDCIPRPVTAGWCVADGGHGSRVLNGYLGILNAGTTYNDSHGPVKATSTASVVLSPASKLIVLQSLSAFLRAGLSLARFGGIKRSQDALDFYESWFFAPAFRNQEAFCAFDSLLQPKFHQSTSIGKMDTRIWSAATEDKVDEDFIHCTSDLLDSSAVRLLSLDDFTGEQLRIDDSIKKNATDGIDYNFLAHLARTLQSTLVSTFLDCAPAVFSPGSNPPDAEVHVLLAVAQILECLYGVLLQHRPVSVPRECGDIVHDLGTILGYMVPYFPFKAGSKVDIKIEQTFQDLNLRFCKLEALRSFIMDKNERSSSSIYTKRKQTPLNPTHGALSKRAISVSKYIAQLLRGEAPSTAQLGRSLMPAAYISLLPAVWLLLDSPTSDYIGQQSEILNAVIEHGLRSPSKSASKRASIEFIARLVLLDTEAQYQGHFRLGRSTEIDGKFEEWLSHLPQCVWEAGAANLPMTEVILRFLLRLLQRKSRLLHAEIVRVLGSKLVPYFSINHATRGRLPGPYTKLPLSSRLRALALDVIATLLVTCKRYQVDNVASVQLITAVDFAVAGTREEYYWSQEKNMI